MTPSETSAGVGTEGKGSDTKNAVSDSDQDTVWVSATGKKTTLLWLKPGQSFCPCGLAQHLGLWAFYGVNDFCCVWRLQKLGVTGVDGNSHLGRHLSARHHLLWHLGFLMGLSFHKWASHQLSWRQAGNFSRIELNLLTSNLQEIEIVKPALPSDCLWSRCVFFSSKVMTQQGSYCNSF